MLGALGLPGGVWAGSVVVEASRDVDPQALREGQLNAERARRSTKNLAEYHFGLAQALAADGAPERAIAEYRLALAFDPQSALIHLRMGAEYVRTGQFASALESAEGALLLEPASVDGHLMRAALLQLTHETQRALNDYEWVLAHDAHAEDAAVNKAQLLLETGRLEEARRFLQAFVRKNGNSALSYHCIGQIEEAEGAPARAILSYRKALELRPGMLQTGLALGALYESQKQFAAARQLYEELYQEEQETTVAERLANLQLKDHRLKEALPYLRAIATMDPQDLNNRLRMGLVLSEIGQLEEARRCLSTLRSLLPESDRVHYYLGAILERQDKLTEALSELKAVPPDSDLYLDSVIHIAHLLAKTQDGTAALSYLKKLQDQHPRDPDFLLLQAGLEEEQGLTGQAVATLEAGLRKLGPQEKLHYALGTLHERLGHATQCQAQMLALLTLNPQNAEALNYLGYTWTTQGVHLEEAERYLKRALQLQPQSGYVLDSWGFYLLRRGRVSDAITALEKAVGFQSDEPVIFSHLGDAYLRANLRHKALGQYEQALHLAIEGELKEEIQVKLDTLRAEVTKREPARVAVDRADK